MNYAMSGWPGRDPPRGGSEGPAPMVDRAPVRGPAGPGRAVVWFRFPPHLACGCRTAAGPPAGPPPPGVCGGGPTGPAGVVAYTRDATTPPPGVVEAPRA